MDTLAILALAAIVVAVVALIAGRKRGDGTGTGGRPNGDGPTHHN